MTDQPTDLRDRIVAAMRRAPFEDLRPDWNAPNGPLKITARTDDLADAVLAELRTVPVVPVSSPPPDQTALIERAAQAIRDSNGSPEAPEWWRTHPQLIPAHVYAAAVLAVLPPPADLAAVLLWAADQIDAETRQAKTDGVLEPDKFRPCRDASAQLRGLAGCQECASGLEHDVHCPTPETHNWGCGCPSDVAAAIASCPGYETKGPSPCRCPCYGCKHHCGAHNPAGAQQSDTGDGDEQADGPTWSDTCPHCKRWYTTSEPGAHEAACPMRPGAEAQQPDSTHSCANCEGIDSDSCLMNPRRRQNPGALERVRRLHDQLAEETDLASPDDLITRGAAAKRIAAALDGWNPTGAPSCDVEFENGARCAKPAGHRPPGSDDPHVPAPVHVGGNAEDCPACIDGGFDMLSYPWECPGPQEQPTASAESDRLRCPQCGEDITDYSEDDHVFRTGDDRPYCSGECVVAAHRAEPQPPAHIGGVADDCPACIAGGLDTIGAPYECPGPEGP